MIDLGEESPWSISRHMLFQFKLIKLFQRLNQSAMESFLITPKGDLILPFSFPLQNSSQNTLSLSSDRLQVLGTLQEVLLQYLKHPSLFVVYSHSWAPHHNKKFHLQRQSATGQNTQNKQDVPLHVHPQTESRNTNNIRYNPDQSVSIEFTAWSLWARSGEPLNWKALTG